jgi:DNA repair protein RecO (recombination protein O)
MVIKTKAVVLHVVKFGDNQLIVDFLTEALGRLSFMIRLPKSAKAWKIRTSTLSDTKVWVR